MTKQQREKIFFDLCEEIKDCNGNTKQMKRLYKATTILDIQANFYNSCLSQIIKTREIELNYIGNNDMIYI